MLLKVTSRPILRCFTQFKTSAMGHTTSSDITVYKIEVSTRFCYCGRSKKSMSTMVHTLFAGVRLCQILPKLARILHESA